MADKTNKGLKVPFGQRAGRLVAPTDDLPAGLECQCTCPGCGAKLILRQGRKRPHFAHHNAPATDNCVSQAIHSAAIQVLLEAKRILIPYHGISVKKYAANGTRVERHLDLCLERMVRFDECRAEVTVSHPQFGTVRPDVIGYRGGKQLFVEMWYTHQVDEEKKAKLAGIGVPAIEIWLQDLDLEEGFAAIEKRVLDERYRHWLFFPGEDKALRRLEAEVDEEVRRLDGIEERKRRLARLKAEARAAGAKRLQQERDAKFLPFRQKANAEKEQILREKLGIRDCWPDHLRLEHRDNAAIQAPHHIWQAAVFHKFIFGKQPNVTSLEITPVTVWVENWFGKTDDITHQPIEAVKNLLFNLDRYGFLLYAGHGTGGKFTVLHSSLERPQSARPLIGQQ